MNDVLRSSEHTQVNQDDDNDKFNVKNYDEDKDKSIDKEKDNSN